VFRRKLRPNTDPRCGFVFVEVSQYPYSRTEIEVQVIVTEVSATLDGTPLDDTGDRSAERGLRQRPPLT
jgi:hypothetical protein